MLNHNLYNAIAVLIITATNSARAVGGGRVIGEHIIRFGILNPAKKNPLILTTG